MCPHERVRVLVHDTTHTNPRLCLTLGGGGGSFPQRESGARNRETGETPRVSRHALNMHSLS